MGVAADINRGFTLAAMNPYRSSVEAHFVPDRRGAMRGALTDLRTHPSKAHQLGMSQSRAAYLDATRALSLEYQAGMYRAFRQIDGYLLHSHECRVEVLRRGERDGYYFTYAS